jgi:predicted nucleic acid-binding Zn finger protein
MAQQILHEPERLARPDAGEALEYRGELFDGFHIRGVKYQVSSGKYQAIPKYQSAI